MKYKYLGRYEYYLNDQREYDTDSVDILVNLQDKLDYYEMNMFMNTLDDSMFHGVMSETNNSSIVLRMSKDNDEFKMWRLY